MSPNSVTDSTPASVLRERIRERTARIAVIGLGYVGLPTVRALHGAGFRIEGFDTDKRKIELLRNGESYLKHLGEDLVRDLAASQRFEPTSDPSILAETDAVMICVPTPPGAHEEPDLSFVRESTRTVARHLHPSQLVVLTSTTYPRTTREEVLPLLAARPAGSRGDGLAANAGQVNLQELGDLPVTLLGGDIVRKSFSSELGLSHEHRRVGTEGSGAAGATEGCRRRAGPEPGTLAGGALVHGLRQWTE